VAPRYSALRIAGERAHERARRGEPDTGRCRRVDIDSIVVSNWQEPVLTLEIRCGPGTYIRALARDLGARLETGAFLSALRRVECGGFREEEAVPLGRASERDWLPLENLLARHARVEVDRDVCRHLCQGRPVPWSEGESGMRVAWCEGAVHGLAEIAGGELRPLRWLAARRVAPER
ncbi:MAG: tRNA pseudouridine(55) synthase TruB, partial [Planctomycetes bacterium]|nr:tRNA pseudouridine(55) synthase TruB [Planctomycetota bacterium]